MSEHLTSQRRTLALLIVAGGTLVLASYLLVFALSPGLRTGLWGGVPDEQRGLYTISMFAAAFGFFPFTYSLWKAVGDEADPLSEPSAARRVQLLYRLVLFPSAAWLPLTVVYIAQQTQIMWWLVRFDLFLVAAGSLGLTLEVWRGMKVEPRAVKIFALIGVLAFLWQTAGLDALLWPASFRN